MKMSDWAANNPMSEQTWARLTRAIGEPSEFPANTAVVFEGKALIFKNGSLEIEELATNEAN